MKSNVIVSVIVVFLLLLVFVACNRGKDSKAARGAVALAAEWAAAEAASEAEFEYSDGTITRYNGSAASVVIPSQIQGQAVTAIGSRAFYGEGLTSVLIPDSVTAIHFSAFPATLTTITIGSNVELGSWDDMIHWTDNKHRDAFSHDFDAVYNYMGKAAGTYNFSNGVWSSPMLDIPVFFIQGGLITTYNGMATSVHIPPHINGQTVTGIADGVFYNKQLTSVTIPDGVTVIGSWAFQENHLTSVTIPDSVAKIWGDAFSVNRLTSITIGANVELGSWDRFQGVEFYASFSNAFDSAYNESGKRAGTYILDNGVWNLPGNRQLATPERYFTFDSGNILKYNGISSSVVIPGLIQGHAVTGIESGAFNEYNRLISVVIPDSVTNIHPFAFNGAHLASITIGANVALGTPREGHASFHPAFDGAFDDTYREGGSRAGIYTLIDGEWIFGTTPESDFEFANGTITGYTGTATTVVIPSLIQGQAVTAIGGFSNKQLISVTIPDSVTKIESGAFYGNDLTIIIIPNSVIKIGSGAFYRNQLDTIVIGAQVELGDWGEGDYYPAFGSFDTTYNNGGKRADTYTSGDYGNTWGVG